MKYIRTNWLRPVAAMIALACWVVMASAGPSYIAGGSYSGNDITVQLYNGDSEATQVKVTIYYQEGKTVHSAEAIVLIDPGEAKDVDLELTTITDDINPMGMVEGPDPIPSMIVMGAVMWSD